MIEEKISHSLYAKEENGIIIITLVIDEKDGKKVVYSCPCDEKKVLLLHDLLHRHLWNKHINE